MGKGAKGDALIIRIDEIQRVQEIRYLGTDGNHYLIVPSSRDNELVAINLLLHNAESGRLFLTVDEEAAEIRGSNTNETYKLLDLSLQNEKNVSRVDSTHPSEGRYTPFIAGPLELNKDFQVKGWLVFDVPKDTTLGHLRWGAGDIVYIRS